MKKKMTMGLIVGNRGFFPDQLARDGREEMIRVLQEAGIEVVAVGPDETKFGAVETRSEARKCADLFKKRADDIDGVIVSLPNFGDERAVADTLRLSGLNVPVLIQATPDSAGQMSIKYRRDSFCGKMSVCNNLRQYGIPYSLTRIHTVAPDSDDFNGDLASDHRMSSLLFGMGEVGATWDSAYDTIHAHDYSNASEEIRKEGIAGVFMAGTLGVDTLAYAPWAVMCYTGFLFALLYGATGFAVAPRIRDDETVPGS